jgi:ferredoxin
MRIRVDQSLCIGSGACAMSAPELFDQDPVDGHAIVLKARPEEHETLLARACVDACPVGAILIDEE